MNQEDNKSWLAGLVSIVLLVIVVFFLFDTKPKTERMQEIAQEIERNKKH